MSLKWNDTNWKKYLEKPEDLLLTRTISNICNYLIQIPKNNRFIQNNSYEMELVKLLQRSINKSTLDSELLSKYDQSTMSHLGRPISSQVPLNVYRPLFKKIASIDKNYKFLNIIKKNFLESINNNNPRIMDTLDFFTLMILIKKFSLQYLKEIPSRTISKSFFQTYENKLRIALLSIFNDKVFQNDLEFLLKLVKKNTKKLKIEKNQTKFLRYLHYNALTWQRDVDELVRNSFKIKLINKSLISLYTSDTKPKKKILIKKIQNSVSSSFFKKFVGRSFFIIAHHTVSNHLGQYMNTTRLLADRPFSKKISDKTVDMIYSDPEERKSIWFNYNSSYALFSAFSMTYSNHISKILQKKYLEKSCDMFIQKYAEFIAKQINVIDTPKNKRDGLTFLYDKWEFYQFLENFLQDLSKKMFPYIVKQIQRSDNETIIHDYKTQMRIMHFDYFCKHLYDKSHFSRIPAMSKTKSKKMISALFTSFKQKNRKFRIICLIGGIDCKGKHFKIGKVHFFDGRTHQFGEGKQFDSYPGAPISLNENFRSIFEVYENQKFGKHTLERKRNSGRAYVDVQAADSRAAINIAKYEIYRAFDDLVYASSAKTKRGFKPQMPIDFVIIEEGKKYSGKTAGPRENDFDTLEINEEYEKIIKFYDKLSQKPPKFNKRLRRAFDWYHRGHWAPMAHEKFVSHWIALEQIILKQLGKKPKSDELLRYVPKLTVMWRKGFKGYAIGRYFQGIENDLKKGSKLEKFLDKNKEFEGWRKNRLIILEHLDLLIPVTSGETKKCVDLIQNEFNKRRGGLKAAVKLERSDVKFIVAVLKAKRNSIFHEGVSYSPELEILAKELEKILIDVIETHLEFHYAESINKIIYEANRPIQVRHPRL